MQAVRFLDWTNTGSNAPSHLQRLFCELIFQINMTKKIVQKNILKDAFGSEKRWVNYRIETRKGKTTKLPYSVAGLLASSTDEKTWSTYDEARTASENIGIVFTPKQDLLGIDIDHCLKDGAIDYGDKEIDAMIEKLIAEANTYCEISPSGNGLHLFLKLTASLTLSANRHSPFEAYTSGRYFTVTENIYREAKQVREVSPDEALSLLNIIGYPWKKQELLPPHGVAPSTITKLDDAQVLQKMFASKNGGKIKDLFDTNPTGVKDVSALDMSLCSHLAFWTGRDADQIERLWLSSSLAQRQKTTMRKDYRARTINNAIASCKEVYENRAMKIEKQVVLEAPELDLLFTLDSKANKVFIQNTENMCRILRHHPNFAGRFRYDAFKNVFEIDVSTSSPSSPLGVRKWRIVEDNDAVDIQTRISVMFSSCFGKVGKEMVYDAIIKVSKEYTIDSAIDFIKSIRWDGVARLDTWLSKTYGVPDDVYHRAVGANWIKGLVKRIVEPGCKFDFVLVLEGEQGSKKSTSLAVLGGDWHVETAMSTESKDFFMQFQGKAIVEFSEGETLSRTEVKRMKAIITMQSDKYRPPYERTSQDFPRRCVFAMTTNQTEYLKDETGNRRWLPVTVVFPQANIEWLAENRNQLLAEAHERIFINHETIYEFPREETLAAQSARRIHDENTDLIADWYYNKLDDANRDKGITIHMVYRDALSGGFVNRPLDRYNEMKISEVLKSLGLIRRREMVEGYRAWRWFHKDAPITSELNRELTVDENFEKNF